MSSLNISNLARMSRESLAAILSSPAAASKLAIVDVRDSDHIGGHIRTSIWVPSADLDLKTPELVRTLRDKDTVVFHCALSQQRGPSAALRYARERRRLLGPTAAAEDEEKESGKGRASKQEQRQEIYVLDGGFTMWQAKYGEDENLTVGYVRDIWMDY